MTIRILLADDQALLRGTFRMLIDSTADMEVVAEACTGREVLEALRGTAVDLVLMDIRMPDLDGIAATRLITGDDGLAGVRILVLTTFEADEYVAEALRAGAGGFIGKGINPDELLNAIRVVAAGEALLSPAATKALIGRFLAQPAPPEREAPPQSAVLTPREREVVALAAAGLSNDEIAERLHITRITAKTHINRSMTKLGARDRAQLVVVAYRTGLARPDAL